MFPLTAELLNIPNDAYHADTGRLSSSMIKDFIGYTLGKKRRGGPAYYRAKYVLGHPDPEQKNDDILVIGSLCGAMLDEPDAVTKRYAVVPVYARRSVKVFEAWRKEQPAGIRPVTDDQWRSAHRMAESVRQKFPEVQQTPGYVERTIHWTDPTGIDCKAKPDKLFMFDTGPVMVERKTTESLERFGYIAQALKYHLQAAHYAEGVRAAFGMVPTVKFLVAERAPPYGANAFDMPLDKLCEALEFRAAAMKRLKWCLTTGNWPETYAETEILYESE